MSRIISAHAIYDGLSNQVLYDYPVVPFNCDTLGSFSPQAVAIKRRLAPGFGFADNVVLTYDLSDPEIDDNTLFGYAIMVNPSNGTGRLVVIDAASVAAIVGACNDCCDDESVTLVGIYTSGIPGIEDLVATTYTLTRTDDGGPYAIQQAELDYWGYIFGGTFHHTAWNVSGVSTYTWQSYVPPVALPGDSIA